MDSETNILLQNNLTNFDYITITTVIITIISISCSCHNPAISDCHRNFGGPRGEKCNPKYEEFHVYSSWMISITYILVIINASIRYPNLAIPIALCPFISCILYSITINSLAMSRVRQLTSDNK